MNNDLGVMQGRLLPKFNGRYQAHPVGFWKEEFEIASDLGLQCIEFIIDKESISENPLLKENGIEDIKKTIFKTGINVKTICADYFMDFPVYVFLRSRFSVFVFRFPLLFDMFLNALNSNM
mgnify:CR=1 FL=1